MTRLIVFAILTASTGCFSPTLTEGLPCTEEGLCPDGLFCTSANECRSSDPDRDDGGMGNADGGEVPLDCEANSVVCESDVLTECNANGDGAVLTECPVGCHDVEVRCNRIGPSNGVGQFLPQAEAANDLVVPAGATFDTTTGVLQDGDGVEIPVAFEDLVQSDDSTLRVFIVRGLSIEGDIVVTGTRSMALVASASISISGTLTVANGPTSACGPTDISFNPGEATSGGAGASLAGLGGKGGDASGVTGLNSNPPSSSVTPLQPGCDGARVRVVGQFVSEGGQGGGALQLVSGRSISIDGTVAANGGGGSGENGVGAGGGSGGVVLLEAPVVIFSGGGISANGGGGGCSNLDGEAGKLGSAQAAGGDCSGIASGSGGAGSGGAVLTGAAGGNAVGTGAGGGGGGGTGYVEINSTSAPSLGAGTFSPVPVTGDLVSE